MSIFNHELLAGKRKVFLFLGLILGIILYSLQLSNGFRVTTAHIISFGLSQLLLFFLVDFKVLQSTTPWFSKLEISFRALFLFALLLLMQGGLLSFFEDVTNIQVLNFTLASILTLALKYCGLHYFFLWDKYQNRETKLQATFIVLILASLVLKLVFLKGPDLLIEEAYYWNYGQHLDWGYLDHPPMVAWLIRLGTTIFGNNEFGVRLPAFLLWPVTAFFSYKYAKNLFGKDVAIISVFLLATLPFYTGIGFFITPDAPLMAYWAATIYFLERAMISHKKTTDWIWVGTFIGLGMISKYTIGLLGVATLVFMLLDRESRVYYIKPGPYLNVIFIALFFSPVIIWNYQNDWASFAFQTTRRLSEAAEFSLDKQLKFIAGQITPLGLLAILRLFQLRKEPLLKNRRHMIFMFTYALVPVSVFLFFSLKHNVRMSWTAPAWLALLPAIASQLDPRNFSLKLIERRLWIPVLTSLMLVIGLIFHYASIGVPNVAYRKKSPKFISWRQMGEAVEKIDDKLEAETGIKPLVICMDSYGCASEMAFYRPKTPESNKNNIDTTTSQNYFGYNGLMYDWWFKKLPSKEYRALVIVSINPDRLIIPYLKYINKEYELGEMEEVLLTKDNIPAGKFFYRTAVKKEN